MAKDSTCPICTDSLDTADLKERPPVRAPWHFWVMVVAAGAYLLWRLVEGLLWVAQNWI